MTAEACWFWTMTLTRLSGVVAPARIVEIDVPTDSWLCVKPRRSGDENLKCDIVLLVSVCHVNLPELSLLTQELIVFLLKNLIGLGLDGSRFLNLSF